MTVSLLEVVRAASTRAAVLAPETAGYLALLAADGMLGSPRAVDLAGVELAPDGAIRIRSAVPCEETVAARSVRALLRNLLGAAPAGAPALTLASARAADSDDLSALVRELEAALIPVNRAAAKRTLARLHRDAARAVESGRLGPVQEVLARADQPDVAPPRPAAPPLVAAAPVTTLPEPPSMPESTLVVPEADLMETGDGESEIQDEPEATPVVGYEIAVPVEVTWDPLPELERTPFLGTTVATSSTPPTALVSVTPPPPPVSTARPQFVPAAIPSLVPTPPLPALELRRELARAEMEPPSVEPPILDVEPPRAEPPSTAPLAYEPHRSDIGSLLSSFTRGTLRSASEVARELKRSVGIDATPAPIIVVVDRSTRLR